MTTTTETPTPTPRVDEKWRQLPDGSESALHEMKACARQLERELTAATAQLEEARRDLQSVLGDAAYYPQLHICPHQRARLEGILAAMQQKEQP